MDIIGSGLALILTGAGVAAGVAAWLVSHFHHH